MSASVVPRDGNASNSARLAIIWLVTAAATFALCGKLYAQYRRFKRLYWDDFFVVLSWAFALPMAVQASVTFGHNSAMVDGVYPSLFLSKPITQFFFYTSLWFVKLSFMVFFRRIGACALALPRLRRYWIVVLWITIITYFALWTLNPYKCWADKGVKQCERDPSVKAFRPASLSVATVLIVVTDCLIIAIPFTLLSNVQKISKRKQIILYLLFSVEIITVIVSIVRCVLSTRGLTPDKSLQVTLILFLTHVEAHVAIIIACVGSLRSLFTHDDQVRSRSHPTTPRLSEKSIKQSFRKRSSPLMVYSSNAYEQSNSMIPLAHIPSPPLEAENFDPYAPTVSDDAPGEFIYPRTSSR